jgi:hypothetical protein
MQLSAGRRSRCWRPPRPGHVMLPRRRGPGSARGSSSPSGAAPAACCKRDKTAGPWPLTRRRAERHLLAQQVARRDVHEAVLGRAVQRGRVRGALRWAPGLGTTRLKGQRRGHPCSTLPTHGLRAARAVTPRRCVRAAAACAGGRRMAGPALAPPCKAAPARARVPLTPHLLHNASALRALARGGRARYHHAQRAGGVGGLGLGRGFAGGGLDAARGLCAAPAAERRARAAPSMRRARTFTATARARVQRLEASQRAPGGRGGSNGLQDGAVDNSPAPVGLTGGRPLLHAAAESLHRAFSLRWLHWELGAGVAWGLWRWDPGALQMLHLQAICPVRIQ